MVQFPELIDSINPDLIKKVLVNLVKIPSENPPGSTKEITRYLFDMTQELGFSSKVIPVGSGGQKNLATSIGDEPRAIVLCGHLDTIPAGNIDSWEVPPFEGRVIDGFVYGRGAADMKAGIAAFLGAMAALHESEARLLQQIVFVGTADEETSMLGAHMLLKTGIMDNTDFLIIGEPTLLRVGIAEKGVLWVKIEARGKAAHGSMPEMGINAIDGACTVIKTLKKILPPDKDDLLGKSTLNIGTIRGGTKINVVPATCAIEADFRVISGVNTDQLARSISEMLRALDISSPCSFSHSISINLPSLQAPQDHPLITCLRNWTTRISQTPSIPIGLTYGTDGAVLVPATQVPFAIFGPGDPAMAHKVNEKVSILKTIKAAQILAASIFDYFSKVKNV
ncbi:MAG: M20 family metallopeptidase [Candidatus Heimdallarchaeota archaeon]